MPAARTHEHELVARGEALDEPLTDRLAEWRPERRAVAQRAQMVDEPTGRREERHRVEAARALYQSRARCFTRAACSPRVWHTARARCPTPSSKCPGGRS